MEDGTIHGQGVTNAYGYLRTEKKYKDFWFSLRFKCEANGNSGVYFHTEFAPGTVNVSQGLQFEIDPDHQPPQRRLVRRRPTVDRLARARGRTGTAPDRLERDAREGGGQPHGRDPEWGRGPELHGSDAEVIDGHIALQLHSGGEGNMRFKDIYVRDLSVR